MPLVHTAQFPASTFHDAADPSLPQTPQSFNTYALVNHADNERDTAFRRLAERRDQLLRDLSSEKAQNRRLEAENEALSKRCADRLDQITGIEQEVSKMIRRLDKLVEDEKTMTSKLALQLSALEEEVVAREVRMEEERKELEEHADSMTRWALQLEKENSALTTRLERGLVIA